MSHCASPSEASSWQLDYQEIKKTFDSAIQRAKEKLTELVRRVAAKRPALFGSQEAKRDALPTSLSCMAESSKTRVEETVRKDVVH